MDGGILMDGEVSIGGNAEGDAMKASVNGRCQRCGQKTNFFYPGVTLKH